MQSEKSFLEVWKEVIYKLKDEGFITDDDIKNRVNLPFNWLAATQIPRVAFIIALRDLFESQHPNCTYGGKKFEKLAILQYCEIKGKPALFLKAGFESVTILDEEIPSNSEWNKNATVSNLIPMINPAIKLSDILHYTKDLYMTRTEAEGAVEAFGELTEEEILEQLSEMATNYEKYYKYLHQELQEEPKTNEPIEVNGGIIDPAVDAARTRRPVDVDNPTKPRVSEIYSFEERRKIFLELNPEPPIVKFQGIDKDTGKVIDRYMTCYIYKNPQGNNGYLIIAEPSQGDKETRIFYLTDEKVKDLMVGEDDMQKFWEDLTREFVEKMTRTQFSKEGQTYTVRHTGDLDDYKQKIQGIVKGVENNSQKETVKRASYKLFGKATMANGLTCVRRSGLDKARRMVLGEIEKTEEKEGDDFTND